MARLMAEALAALGLPYGFVVHGEDGLDEVSITNSNRNVGATQPIPLDLARLEVLRGPQGTLYGASSEGGTVRFIHNKPELDKASGFVDGTLSDTSHGGLNYEASGVVNLPIIADQLAFRIGGKRGFTGSR